MAITAAILMVRTVDLELISDLLTAAARTACSGGTYPRNPPGSHLQGWYSRMALSISGSVFGAHAPRPAGSWWAPGQQPLGPTCHLEPGNQRLDRRPPECTARQGEGPLPGGTLLRPPEDR